MKRGLTLSILGPGAVGGLLAVRLARAGLRVVCVARPPLAATILTQGLTLNGVRARPEAVERLQEPVDLLLVTVKAPALAEALERIAAPAALVVPLLNGLEHVDQIRSRLSWPVACATIGRLEAYRVSPTRVVQRTTEPPLVTIARDHLPAGLVEQAAAALEAGGVEVRLVADGRAALWEKAARLAPLAALTAATGLPLGRLRRDPRLRAAVEEACAVARADGAPTSVDEQWAILDGLPDSLTTSTARDLAAGRPSELDAIVGAVVRAGRRLGVPTPTLDDLLRRCPA